MEPQQSFFFLFGTPKCGTTWLSKNLLQSTQFYNAHRKEWRLWPSHLITPARKSIKINKLESNINEKQALYDLFKASCQSDQKALNKMHSKLMSMKSKHRRIQNSDEFLSDAVQFCQNNSQIVTIADMTPGTGMRLNLEKINQMQLYFRLHGMNTKCIWLIRDPLNRSISALKMKLANQQYGITSTGEMTSQDGTIPKHINALNDKKRLEHLLKFSRYDRFWCKYASLDMPKEIYFYEDFFTQSQLSRITNFLCMDEVILMPEVVNKGEDISIDASLKASLAKSLKPTYEYVAKLYGWENLPPQWRKSYLKIRQ